MNNFAAQINMEHAKLKPPNLEERKSRKERQRNASKDQSRSQGKCRAEESKSDWESIFDGRLDQEYLRREVKSTKIILA